MSLIDLSSPDSEGVRVLSLDDPDRRNALSPELQTELGAAIDVVAGDDATRVLVVTGRGSAFCAGADLPALFGDTGRDTATIRKDLRRIYDSFLRLRRLEIPTVAAVNGPAVGAGLNLAMACDIRIAGPDAKFGVTFTHLGLHPGGGCTWFLTEVLGRQRAFALIMDGGTLTADEALRLGLVLDVVVDPVEASLERARRWAKIAPLLARDIKHATEIAENVGFDETLDFEAWAQAASTRNPLLEKAVARYSR